MVVIADLANRTGQHAVLRAMFEARKQVFVDLLKWDLPVLAGRFEVDQFDDIHAVYLIVTGGAQEHLASARLLDTTRSSLLETLFPSYAARGLPRGPTTREITRFCLAPRIGARQRRAARDRLLVGLVQYARANGIRTYTGIAEPAWFEQIRRFGWTCRALGPPALHRGMQLIAFRIEIDAYTLERLAAAGIGNAPAIADARAEAA